MKFVEVTKRKIRVFVNVNYIINFVLSEIAEKWLVKIWCLNQEDAYCCYFDNKEQALSLIEEITGVKQS